MRHVRSSGEAIDGARHSHTPQGRALGTYGAAARRLAAARPQCLPSCLLLFHLIASHRIAGLAPVIWRPPQPPLYLERASQSRQGRQACDACPYLHVPVHPVSRRLYSEQPGRCVLRDWLRLSKDGPGPLLPSGGMPPALNRLVAVRLG
ncbi:hypothetical protein MANI_005173 [Metarhizium anisopliae]|nr:hypothetical protein MANI_005173 [Metarhizium anisopliae]